jgi:hypothetical protein
MDPKDWEKQKRQLFNFNAAGEITGLTAAGKAVREALSVVEIGRFIDEQENLTVSIGNQIEALNRLTAAGASYEAAYKAVQNTAFATAVATATSADLIRAAAESAMAAMSKMREFEKINEEEERKKRISEAVREQNKEFSNQAKILDYITKNRSKLGEAQIREILNNKDLQSLVLEPTIDPSALSTALANAQKRADLELRIKKLTVEGQEDIFQEGISSAMSAFSALEEEIDLEFRATIKDDGSLVRDAERQIALIDFELDDYQAGLEEIDRLEEDINEVYDKRLEALDRVLEVNEDIARAQESQLDIADALSKGDIAAAARAVQQSRQIQQESANEAQRRMLEEQRTAEIARLRSSSGMSREDLQKRVRDLEEQIFNIEERTLEPAQERIRLAEITRDDRVADLQVLGKTREEWNKISNSVDVAQANGWRFADAMQEALNIVEKLVDSLTNRPAPPPPPAPAPAPSSGGGGGPALERKSEWTFDATSPYAGQTVAQVAKAKGYAQWQDFYGQNPGIDYQIIPKIKRAYGGIVGRSRSGPPQQYFDGGKVRGPGTEKSDSIPAMLSNGEYVINASAVRSVGVDFLDSINRGSGGPTEKDGMPGYFLGGLVSSVKNAVSAVKSVFTPKPPPPPPSPRAASAALRGSAQATRAASAPAPRPTPAPAPRPTQAPIVNAISSNTGSSYSASAAAARPSAPAPTTSILARVQEALSAAPAPVAAFTPSVIAIEKSIESAKVKQKAIDNFNDPGAITQDTRSPMAKTLDNIANTMRQTGVSNYLPDPKKAIRDAIDFFLPFTSESMKNSETGLPTFGGFAADVGIYAGGSLLGRIAAPLVGTISKALKVPTVAVPGAIRGSGPLSTGTSNLPFMQIPGMTSSTQSTSAFNRGTPLKPSTQNTVSSPNAVTIRQQQEEIAQQTAKIYDEIVAKGKATGAIKTGEITGESLKEWLALSSYKKALVKSDRMSSGPIISPSQEILDNTTHISQLSPEGLLAVAKSYVSKAGLDAPVNPYLVRTDNQRTFIASTNPLENFWQG